MTREEAIKYAKENILAYTSEMSEFKALAIKALEKQIPKKPTNNSWTHYHCPVCMKSVNSKYCSACGQRIDWEE